MTGFGVLVFRERILAPPRRKDENGMMQKKRNAFCFAKLTSSLCNAELCNTQVVRISTEENKEVGIAS